MQENEKTARKIYIYIQVPTPPWIILRETFAHCVIPIGRVAKHRPLAVPLKFQTAARELKFGMAIGMCEGDSVSKFEQNPFIGSIFTGF